MNTILITGGYGFVGTQLLRLIPKEYNITVLDNLIGYAGQMPESVPDNHTFVFGDIRDRELIQAIVPRHDIVVHLAGIVGFPACRVNRNVSSEINVAGTRNITESLTRSQKLIFISSSSVYGHQTQEVVDEYTPIQPMTEYGEHKADGEFYVKAATAPWIILRPATAFGKSDRLRLDLLPNTMFYDAIVGGKMAVFEPKAIRSFIHVLDFARAIKYCIDGEVPWDSIYNIGNDALTLKKIELIQRISRLTGAKILGREGSDPDQRNYWLDFTKFSQTGFTYLPDTLELAHEQILAIRDEIAHKYEEFTSPYLFSKSLEGSLRV